MEAVNNEKVDFEPEVEETGKVEEVVEEADATEKVPVNVGNPETMYADCILYNRNEILEAIGILNTMEIRGVQNATAVARINEILDTHGNPVRVPVQAANGNVSV